MPKLVLGDVRKIALKWYAVVYDTTGANVKIK